MCAVPLDHRIFAKVSYSRVHEETYWNWIQANPEGKLGAGVVARCAVQFIAS